MGRQTEEQMVIKSKALRDAFESLKAESTIGNDLVTYDNILERANSSEEAIFFETPISMSTLKQSKNASIVKLRKDIKLYKNESKTVRENIQFDIKNEIHDLNEMVDNLTSEIIIFEEERRELKKSLKHKDHYIEKVEKIRDDYAEIIANMRRDGK